LSIRSEITCDEDKVDFVVLHLGGHNLNAGVRVHRDDIFLRDMQQDLRNEFLQNNVPQVISRITEYFGEQYTLWDLFKNEQGDILEQIMKETQSSIDKHFQEIYDEYYPLMLIKKDMRIPLPQALSVTVEFVLNRDLRLVLQKDRIDLSKLEKLINEILRWGFMKDKGSIALVASESIERLMSEIRKNPDDVQLMGMIESTLRLLSKLSLPLNLWKVQNIYFLIGKEHEQGLSRKIDNNNQTALFWMECFRKLGKCLNVKVAIAVKQPQVQKQKA